MTIDDMIIDPIDHPFLAIIQAIPVTLGLVLCITFNVLAALAAGNPYNYKYTDIDGNEGYARSCHANNSLRCYTDNGYVQVKEFHKNEQN